MLVIGLVIASRQRGRVLAGALVIVVATVGYFGFVAPEEARERVTTVDSGTGRTDIWGIAWRMVEDRPVNGVGLSNFQASVPDYLIAAGELDVRYVFNEEGVATVTHNIYLDTLASLGVVGLALFLIVIALPTAASLAAARRFQAQANERMEGLSRALFVTQVGVLTSAFFASLQFSNALWLLLALGPACLALANAEDGSAPQSDLEPLRRA